MPAIIDEDFIDTSEEFYSGNNYISHVGVSILNGAPGVGSGRYQLGSGENPYQHNGWLVGKFREYREAGLSDEQIANKIIYRGKELPVSKMRSLNSILKSEYRRIEIAAIKKLQNEGKSLNEIADILGYKNGSVVKSIMNPVTQARLEAAEETYKFLKSQVDEKGYVKINAADVYDIAEEVTKRADSSIAANLGISEERLNQAIILLEDDGYKIYTVDVPQVNRKGQYTKIRTLCKPDSTYYDAVRNRDNIQSVTDYQAITDPETGKLAFVGMQKPSSLNSSRIAVKYKEDGGALKDGLIEIRPGVEDLNMGDGINYCQVRILVDGTHYIKGMAIYSNNLPDGVDLLVNSNKSEGTPLCGPKNNSVLKPIKIDSPDQVNPFGASIKPNSINEEGLIVGGQSEYIDSKTGEKKLSVINKRAEEGDWNSWDKNIASQFLAKQNTNLVARQLNISINDKINEYNEIMSLTNPTVKKELLLEYADLCDATAVNLKAAALPGQSWKVILPTTNLSDDEIYAPQYENGSKVALVRYPHGGTFEIPILTVNNSKKMREEFGNDTTDMVAITKKSADKLSGADFDGDTVLVIPTDGKTGVHITSRTLKELEGFDGQVEYKIPDGDTTTKRIKDTQREMGVVSNLIMDMTIQGAPDTDLAKAVKHSMVIIDAEKHDLDYKQSEIDNDIALLKEKWQKQEDGKTGGAATLLTRAKSQEQVVKRQGSYSIDPETGEKKWKIADDAYFEETKPVKLYDENGKVVRDEDGKIKYQTYTNTKGEEVPVRVKTGEMGVRHQSSTKMAETSDARTLSTGTPVEELYAEYANNLKSLANSARLEYTKTPNLEYNSEAAKLYSDEVSSLNSKLEVFNRNKPRENQATIQSNKEISKLIEDNPELAEKSNAKLLSKYSQQIINKNREKYGASSSYKAITIDPDEWTAIQSGAIHETKLRQILKGADMDIVKQYSMPKTNKGLSNSQIALIKSRLANGYTASEIASAMGISVSSVEYYKKEG